MPATEVYDGIVCPFCETEEVEVLVVQAYRKDGTEYPEVLGTCTGCGLCFKPPKECTDEVRKRWSLPSSNPLECRFCCIKSKNVTARKTHENYCRKNPNRIKRTSGRKKLKGSAQARYHCFSCGKQFVTDYDGDNVSCPNCMSKATEWVTKFALDGSIQESRPLSETRPQEEDPDDDSGFYEQQDSEIH